MRIFLGIALLILGFMIWRLHQDIQQVHDASVVATQEVSKEVTQLHDEAKKGIEGMATGLRATHDKIGQIEAIVKQRRAAKAKAKKKPKWIE
jgi:hypothetical protein